MTEEKREALEQELHVIECAADDLYGTAPMQARLIRLSAQKLRVVLGLLVIIFMGVSYGCRVTGGLVESDAARAARLEEKLSELESAVDGCVGRLEGVQEKAGGIEDGVDRAIFLFDAYDRAVRELIGDYRRLEEKYKALEEGRCD